MLRCIRYALKGQPQRELELSGADLVAGPNGAGKTAALTAITAGLYGLAESPSDTQRPYLGPIREGFVELVFDGGQINRNLAETRTKAATRATVEAERTAGAHLVRWDLADFASSSEQSRENLLRRICGGRKAASLELPATAQARALVSACPQQGDAGTWLAAALEWCRARFAELNSAQKAATQGASDAETALRGISTVGTLAEAQRRLSEAQTQMVALRADAASATREAMAAEQQLRARDAWARRVGSAQEELDRMGPPPDVAALKVRQEEALAVWEQLRDAARSLGLAAKAARQPYDEARAAYARALGGVDTVRGMSTSGACCRHCGMLDPLGSALAIANAEEAAEDLRSDMLLAERRWKAAEEAAGDCSEKFLAAKDAAAEAEQAWSSAIRLQQRRAELETAAAEPEPDLPNAPRSFGGKELLEALEQELPQLKAAVESHVRAAERLRLHQEAIARREAAVEAFTEIKALGERLKELQTEVVGSLYGPLQTAANELLEVTECGLAVEVHSAADFGAVVRGAYVSFWSLSDSERAIVGAALALAIVRLSGSPWKGLVIDGLEKVDSSRLPGLLAGMVEARRQGWIDNFVGALVATEPPAVPDGVTVHWLGGM